MALEDAKQDVDGAFTRAGLKGRSAENTFGGATSFLRRRYTKDLAGVDIAVTGMPFDQAVTNRPGARLGPRAIREASALQVYDPPYGWGGYDPLERAGHCRLRRPGLRLRAARRLPAGAGGACADGILDQGAAMIALGGDHSITLPLLRAHAKRHGPLALLQIDAHTDTWPDDDPARVDHGTLTYKAVKEGLIDVRSSAHVGIRTVVEDNLGIEVFDARAVHELGAAEIAKRVQEILGDVPVYLSFDIDALDPAFAPGTGTPVWGGLTTAQAAILLRDIAGINLVGGDVVEVSPPFDHGQITAVAGAHVAMELLCLWGWTRR